MSRPDHFYASIGGYMGPSYTVELQDDILVYTRSSDEYETEEVVELEPTDDQWNQFLEILDEVDFWDWDERYEDPNICDGTHWKIQIEVDDRRHESSGSNAYPGPGYEARITDEAPDKRPFEKFTEALETLLGDRDFR